MAAISLGLDFGTESVRAILVDTAGRQRGIGSCQFAHGQLTDTLPSSQVPLPTGYALQHPDDWLDAAAIATQSALHAAGSDGDDVVGIGVDFTSCTMLPTDREGTPLCQLPQFRDNPLAWPKLWKHHGAVAQTDRLNAVARQRDESFLQRYGGTIGLEWLLPKILETIESAPEVAASAARIGSDAAARAARPDASAPLGPEHGRRRIEPDRDHLRQDRSPQRIVADPPRRK